MDHTADDLRTNFKADRGLVFVDGDPLPLTLTPEAALELGDRAIEAATDAFGQRALQRVAQAEERQAPNSGPSSSG